MSYVDYDGRNPLLVGALFVAGASYAGLEIGLTLSDAYLLYQDLTAANQCLSPTNSRDVAISAVGLLVGMALPGAGYGTLGRGLDKALSSPAAKNTAKSADKLLPSPRRQLLVTVSDSKLRNRVDALYRPNAKYGNGGTADAIRHEIKTGELLSPSGHSKKGIEMRNGLMQDLKSGRLNEADKRIARDLLRDLQNALSGN